MRLVIWDADETLWEGKITYGNVFLKYETKEIMKQLNKLGIKQYVCSKNNLEDVKKQLDKFELTKYLDGIRVSWEPKNLMIREIIEEAKTTEKETLFIDDESINRAEISEIIGCHVDYDKDLYNIMKYFDTDRLLLMRQERKRDDAEKEFRGTFKEFLGNSGMVYEIRKGHIGILSRIINLANRTNELNASRTRYTEKQIKDILEHPSYLVNIITLKDNYGDYGIIGEAIIKREPTKWIVQDLCISCRVMGRGMGTKLMLHIINMAKNFKVNTIESVINLSKENFRMPKLYEKLGFIKTLERDNKIWYELNI